MFYFGPRGQGLLEYGLVIIFVAIVVMVVLLVFGAGVGNMFSNIIANV